MRKILPIKYPFIVVVLALFFGSVTWMLQKIQFTPAAVPVITLFLGMGAGYIVRRYFSRRIANRKGR